MRSETIWRETLRLVRPGRGGRTASSVLNARASACCWWRRIPSDEWWAMCVRQADLLVVVAAVRCAVSDAPPLGRTQVGPRAGRARQPRGDVRDWQAALGAYRITQATGPLPAAVRPVAARVAGRSVGVVMGGGGARAFAHLGVLMELEAAGIVVDRVAGASQGPSSPPPTRGGSTPRPAPTSATRSSSATTPTTTTGYHRVDGEGPQDRAGAAPTPDRIHIEELPRTFRCVSTDLQTRAPYVHRTGDLTSAVMASISIPGLFPPRRDGQRLLVDGGVLANLPVQRADGAGRGPDRRREHRPGRGCPAAVGGRGGCGATEGPHSGAGGDTDALDVHRQRRRGAGSAATRGPSSCRRRRWAWGSSSSTSWTGWWSPVGRRAALLVEEAGHLLR